MYSPPAQGEKHKNLNASTARKTSRLVRGCEDHNKPHRPKNNETETTTSTDNLTVTATNNTTETTAHPTAERYNTAITDTTEQAISSANPPAAATGTANNVTCMAPGTQVHVPLVNN